MTARRIMWPLTILLIGAVVALAVPGSPFYLSDVLASGWHYHGRSTDYWIKELGSDDPHQRHDAIFALGAIQPPAEAAVPHLAAIMTESPDRDERNQAALALSKMAPASRLAVAALAKALSDEEPWVRMNAVMALSRLREEARPAIPELVQAMNDRTNNTDLSKFGITIQQVAALTLGRCSRGNADAIAALTQILEKKGRSDWMCLYAVQALGEIGPEASPAAELIRPLLNHRMNELRESAVEALRQIEGTPAAGS